VLCRLRVGPRDWRLVARFFAELWPERLAARPPATVDEVLERFARSLPAGVLGSLETVEASGRDAADAADAALSAEHRRLVQEVLAALGETPLFARVRGALRTVEPGAVAAAGPRAAELITLLVLASPAAAFASLPAALASEVEGLRAIPPGSPLRVEVEVLAGQLATLMELH
jgi:hypothetical protein